MKLRSNPKKSPKKGNRGIALIMVLVITTVLSAIAADMENETRVNLRAAANARDHLQAYFHARSAVELELFVLRLQGLIQKALKNIIPIPLFELSGVLVSSDTMKGIVSGRGSTPQDDAPREEGSSLGRDFGNFRGSFWIERVVDENRKININEHFGPRCTNLLQPFLVALIDDPKYDPLFETMGESTDPIKNRLEIIAQITDWVDTDSEIDPVCFVTQDQTGHGTEDSHYDDLPYGARYKPKNKKFASLEELRMVPGVNDAFMQLFAEQLTVWGANKGINVWTAEPLILGAVVLAVSPGFQDREKFQLFLQNRLLYTTTPGAPKNEGAFKQLLTGAEIPLDQTIFNQYKQRQAIRFDDVSNMYKITAGGRVGDASSTIHVVWLDDGTRSLGAQQLFYWREE